MPARAILQKTKLLSQRPSLQHAAILFSGKAGVQLIALLTQPILARLYSPAQFGEFALFNSILAILLIASCGRYDAAIVLTKHKQQAERLFQLSQTVLLGFTGLLILLLLLVPFHRLPKLNEISSSYLWLFPLLVLLSGYWQIIQNWLIKLKKFNQISLANIIQRLIIFGGALLAFFLETKINGLIISLISGAIGVFIIGLLHQTLPLKAPLKSLRNYAFHFRDFPLYSVPTLFLNLITFHLPVIWISYFFNSQEAGSYSMAFMLISLPYTGICISIAPVFYERMASNNKKNQQDLLLKVCLLYGTFSAFLTAIVFIAGEAMSIWLLGNNWAQTGAILRMLSPLMIIQGIEAWLMISLSVFRRQKITLWMQGLKLILWGIAFASATLSGELFISFRLMSFLGLLYVSGLSYIVFKISKKRNDLYRNCTLANR
jgi:lipopolysaccharide exporter